MSYKSDWKKIVLTELKPGFRLHTLEWSQVSPTTYSCSWSGATGLTMAFGELLEVSADGVALSKQTSYANCDATPDSFYFSFFGRTLHVRLTSGDNPGSQLSGDTYDHNIIGTFTIGIVNGQFAGDDCIDFIPEGCTYPIYYEPWLNENSLSSLSASVAANFESAMEVQFGSISFLNTGWWYVYRHYFLWNNRDVKVKVGMLGDSYSDFETIFVGRVRNLKVSDESATFELVDNRVGALYSLPTKRYSLDDFPNLDPDAVNRPIPILFGQKTNITPIEINTASFVYKISDTIWGGVTFALQSIDAVYRAGSMLTVTTDYTVDLNNGQFTLLVDPGDAVITCDAKGIKDAFDMATGLKTGAYSENVANHLFFIFNILNSIPVARMDLASFLELQTARTQKIALLIDTDIPTMDVNRLFQQSTIYHFLPLLDGTFAARYYRRVVPAGTLELQYYDLNGFAVSDQAENVYYSVIVKYDKDPTTGIYKTVSTIDPKVESDQSEKKTFEVETALRDVSEAESVMGFYATLLNAPADKLETEISLIGKNLLPTDKLKVSRSIETDSGQIVILSEEIYVLLETVKDLAGGVVDIVAQLDSQLSIYAIHADSPHQDEHGDHTDSEHSDGTYWDHVDVPHDDIAHGDTPYEDIPHGDYTDHGEDPPHEDSSHVNTPHVDVAHEDSPYEDVTTYVDHTDSEHVDSHTDVSHIDSEV